MVEITKTVTRSLPLPVLTSSSSSIALVSGQMKSARLFWAVLAVIAFTTYPSQSQTRPKPAQLSKIRIPLLTGWQFREVGKDKWYPATVPGCVHTDLLNNRLIDDPFYRD